MTADVNTQSRIFYTALAENRNRDAWTVGRQVLAACSVAIADLREQAQRRRHRTPWIQRIFAAAAATDHDADAIAHYRVVAEETVKKMRALPPNIDYDARHSLTSSSSSSSHIVAPEPINHSRSREIQDIRRRLEETADLLTTVGHLANQADPLIVRIDDSSTRSTAQLLRGQRHIQQFHDAHVSVSLSQQPPAILFRYCGLTLVEEIRLLVVVAFISIVYLFSSSSSSLHS